MQTYLVLACILLLGAGGYVQASRAIPDYIHICKRTDPEVAKCIRESVEALRPRLKNGIPELDVPPLDPFFIEEIVIFRGDDSSNFRASLKDVRLEGPSNFEIKKVKVSADRNTYRAGVTFPFLRMTGTYDVDARILVVPIKGHGTFNANITNAEGQAVIKAEIINHNGHRQMNFTSFNMALKVQDYSVHLENLFNGDPILSRAANDVLNDNSGEFLNGALPFIQRKTSEILLEAANKVTNDLDYDQVFPE